MENTTMQSMAMESTAMEKTTRGWINILKIIIPYFVVIGVFQLIGMLLTGVEIQAEEMNLTSFQNTVIAFLGLVGTLLLIALYMKKVDKEKIVNLGFHSRGRIKEILSGILIPALIMLTGYGILISSGEIKFQQFNIQLVEIFYSVIFFISVAFAEEVFFRGYILGNLLYSFNKFYSLLISSLLFALAHSLNPNISWFSFFDIALAGFFLGTSYVYTKNLWFPIALHLSWNFFQTHFGFNVSGADVYSIIETQVINDNLLSGGDFGFEGSIISVVAEIICIVGVYLYYSKRKEENSEPLKH